MFIELENYVVNASLIERFDSKSVVLHGRRTEGLAINDSDYKKLCHELLPRKRTLKKDKGPKSELLELFEELHRLTGGIGKAVFSLKREEKLKDLMGTHRLTKEDLIKAATNIGKDEFLQGKNDRDTRYGDIDYLLRPDKAAKWAEDVKKKQKSLF